MYLGVGSGFLGALIAWIISKAGASVTMRQWVIGGAVIGLLLAPILAVRRAYKDIKASNHRTLMREDMDTIK